MTREIFQAGHMTFPRSAAGIIMRSVSKFATVQDIIQEQNFYSTMLFLLHAYLFQDTRIKNL